MPGEGLFMSPEALARLNKIQELTAVSPNNPVSAGASNIISMAVKAAVQPSDRGGLSSQPTMSASGPSPAKPQGPMPKPGGDLSMPTAANPATSLPPAPIPALPGVPPAGIVAPAQPNIPASVLQPGGDSAPVVTNEPGTIDQVPAAPRQVYPNAAQQRLQKIQEMQKPNAQATERLDKIRSFMGPYVQEMTGRPVSYAGDQAQLLDVGGGQFVDLTDPNQISDFLSAAESLMSQPKLPSGWVAASDPSAVSDVLAGIDLRQVGKEKK